MKTKTRLKLTIAIVLFLAAITGYAIRTGMENVALSGIGGLMTILSAYIWGETKRPSN